MKSEKPHSLINIDASLLWKNSLQAQDRVLITGSSGWFGRTVVDLCGFTGIDTLAISRGIWGIDHPNVAVSNWDEQKILAFKPTIIIDCAFQTREKLKSISFTDYVSQNNLLISRLTWLASLESVRLVITVSSGAAVYPDDALKNSIESNPYGFQKRIAEEKLSKIASTRGISCVIPRAWSVSGAFCNKPQTFVFTDFISQALSGHIRIMARNLVYRRYTAVEDLFAVSLASAAEQSVLKIDSGGKLIEIYELAQRISELVPNDSTIYRDFDENSVPDKYYSDGISWDIHCLKSSFVPESLNSQISKVVNVMLN